MPRLPLVLLLAVAVAGCDAAGVTPPTEGPPTETPTASALVGTWALADYAVAASVTSQIAQTIALPAEGSREAVRASGAETLAFRYIGTVGTPRDSTDGLRYSLYLVTDPTWPEGEGALDQTHLQLTTEEDGGSIRLERQRATYRVDLDASSPPFELRDGVLTVPERTLTASDGSTVTVGGSLVFPTLALAAGQAVEVPLPSPRAVPHLDTPYFTAITYSEDGTLRAVAGEGLVTDTLKGTWAEVAPDRVRHTYTFDHGPFAEEYTVAVENGALSLRSTGPRATGGFASRTWSVFYLAELDSFAEFWFPRTYRLAPAAGL